MCRAARFTWGGVAAGLVLGMAACAGSAPVHVPPSATGGDTVATAAFSAAIPAGWADASRDTRAVAALHAPGPVLALLVSIPTRPQSGTTAVRPTLSISTVAGGPIAADAVAGYLGNVSAAGARNVSQPEPVTVGGVAGEMVTYDHDIGGTPARAEDVVVTRAGVTYEIILDTDQGSFGAASEALQGFLASWHWRV